MARISHIFSPLFSMPAAPGFSPFKKQTLECDLGSGTKTASKVIDSQNLSDILITDCMALEVLSTIQEIELSGEIHNEMEHSAIGGIFCRGPECRTTGAGVATCVRDASGAVGDVGGAGFGRTFARPISVGTGVQRDA